MPGTMWQGSADGGSNASWWTSDVHTNLPTIAGSSVGLPANTIYIRPSDGALFRTVPG